jgi:hypothetical protein
MSRSAKANPESDYAAVVLAYGDSPFLPMCLASWAGQTRKVRVLIATSTPSAFIDGVANEFGLPVVVNPVGGGIAQDWNFGLHASGARYVTLAHQDDVYDPRFVQETLEAFAAEPAAALCFTGYQEIDDVGAIKGSKISRIKGLIERTVLGRRTRARGARLRTYLSFGNPLPCSSVTFDMAKLGRFAFSTELKSNLDWDAWLSLCREGAVFARAPDKLVGRRHNELTETSRLIKSGRRQEEDLLMFRRLWPRPLSDVIAYVYRTSY